MTRFSVVLVACALVACTPAAETPAPDDAAVDATATPADALPDPTALPTPPQEARVGAMNVMCGGESFRIAFEDARAVLVDDDGSNTELPKLEASADSEPGVTTYTNGTMTFARSGGQDAPAVIRFARGRMAFQDCAVSQN